MTPWPTGGPHFGWSFTRDRMLRSCPRLYYYHYHLAPDGRRPDAAAPARRAYVLKHLTSLDLVLGLAIHRAAHLLVRAMQAKRPLASARSLWAGVRDGMNRACESSRHLERFLLRPGDHTMLREVYYEGHLQQPTVERVRQKAVECLENLRQAALWDTLRVLPRGSARIVDRPVRFRVGAISVWAAPDLVYRTPDGEEVVVDWKTGRKDPGAEVEQVSVYGLILRTAPPRADKSGLRATVVHLRSGEETDYCLTDDRLAAAEARIRESMEAMRECQSTVDQLGPHAIDHFPLTDRRALCPRCNFFELCADALREPAGRAAPPMTAPEGPRGPAFEDSPAPPR